MRRLPALDGLRGIAVLSVLLFHMSPQTVWDKLALPLPLKLTGSFFIYPISNLGWAGVDLFFVLSGFLITGILLETKELPGYFRNFYARRTLRIFPIYYLVLLTLLVVLPLMRPAEQASSLFHHQIVFWLYLQNWLETFRTLREFDSGYLGHTWSLAVEEQFYLVWPLIVFSLSSRKLARFCMFCIGLSFTFRCFAVIIARSNFEAYSFVHFNVLTRVDALAMGALIAVLERRDSVGLARLKTPRVFRAVAGVLILLLVCVLRYGPRDPQINSGPFHTIGYTIVAGLFALILIKTLADEPSGWWAAFLRNRGLRFCGLISYGLYIYHLPVYYFLHASLHGSKAIYAFPIVALPLTFAMAYLSYRFLESPLLLLKRHFVASRLPLGNSIVGDPRGGSPDSEEARRA